MSDELFTIEQSLPTPLQIARRKLDEISTIVQDAEDETGNVPKGLLDALLIARNDVKREELRVLNGKDQE